MKKNIIASIVSIFVILLFAELFSTQCYAIKPAVNFDRDTGTIAVSGTLDNTNRGTLTMLKITNQAGDIAHIDAVNSVNNRYQYMITMDTQRPTGVYNCSVSLYGFDNVIDTFILNYYNKTDISSCLNELNQTKTKTNIEMKTVFKKYRELLGFDYTLYDYIEQKSGDLSAVYDNLRVSETFQTINDVRQAFLGSLIAVTLNNATVSDISKILSDNDTVLSLNVAMKTIYSDFSPTNLLEANSKLLHKNLKNISDITSAYNDAVFTTFVHNANNWVLVQNITNNNQDLLSGVNYTKLGFIKNKGKVYGEVVGKLYADIVAYSTDLNLAIIKQYNLENSPTTSVGGGGSGGSPSGMVKLPQNDTNQTLPASEVDSFKDLGSVLWAVDSINFLKNNKIINGKTYDLFAPNDYITREEFVKMLILSMGITTTSGELNFHDISNSHWCYPYILTAYKANITKGYSEEQFGLGENITRQDMAVMAYKALIASGKRVDSFKADFKDSDDIDDYAIDIVGAMQSAKIIQGTNGRFEPKKFSIRAEAAKIVFGIYVFKG